MPRFLTFIFISFTLVASSQRIFTANGVLLSFLDWESNYQISKTTSYRGALVQPSVSLGFETKIWKRFSLTVSAANFRSGGKNPYNPYYSNGNGRITFNNTSAGVVANYYAVNKNTQFYIGLGPRIDYVKPGSELSSAPNMYQKKDFNQVKVGLTGNIGTNYQFNDFYFGIRLNYYYRFGYLFRSQTTNGDQFWGNTLSIRDNLFDLQLVFGYQFGKKKKAE